MSFCDISTNECKYIAKYSIQRQAIQISLQDFYLCGLCIFNNTCKILNVEIFKVYLKSVIYNISIVVV